MRLAGGRRQLAYSVEINSFSPIGEWEVQLLDGCLEYLVIQSEKFCVPEAGELDLTVESRKIQTGPGFPRCGGYQGRSPDGYQALAGAYLGDEPARPAAPAAQAPPGHGGGAGPSALGGDRFRFEGRAGDTIEVVLDRDGARGSDGKLARLSLRQARGAALGEREGAVPLSSTPRCRRRGSYVIEVAEVADGPGGEAFRGYYQLGVDSASNAKILLEPLDSVEP